MACLRTPNYPEVIMCVDTVAAGRGSTRGQMPTNNDHMQPSADFMTRLFEATTPHIS
jgi:hypothetical protein